MKSLFSTFLILIAASIPQANAETTLDILESYTVPAMEISGMAWRTNPVTKAQELVIVGDREYAIYLINWETRLTDFKVRKIDLQHLKTKSDGKQSEWESVYSDESGRIFIVKERPSKILVLNENLKTLERVIVMNRPFDNGTSNSGSEGIFPLRNGHVLIVNEKDPLKIIEYGPEGKRAVGYSPELSVEQKGLFPIESVATNLSPLHIWRADGPSQAKLLDSSGLNANKDGDLFLLSDENKGIGFIGNLLSTKYKDFKVTQYWKLPPSLKQPEGMVIDSENRPVIAVDSKKTDKTNLYLLSKMK